MLSTAVLLLLIDFCVGGHTKDANLVQRAASPGCTLGFNRHKSSCYLFSHNTATYGEALSFCRFFNSSLTQISSKDEYAYIRGHLKRKGEGFNYYIGGTDLRVEGIWTWENPVRKMSYLNWYPGEPNSHGGREHCLDLLAAHGYKMNDFPCDEKSRFICEINL